MKSKRNKIEFIDFSGGLITNVPVTAIDTKFTPDSQNVYTDGSILRKRKGISRLNSSTVGAGVKGNGFFNWVKSISQQVLMSVFDNTLYKMDLSGSTWNGTWDVISADATNGTPFTDSIIHFATFAGTLLFTTESKSKPQRMAVSDTSHFDIDFNGSGVAPFGKYLQIWKQHVWILNIGAGGALTEEFDSVSSWVDNDTGSGISAQASFQGTETAKFIGGNADAASDAIRTRDIGTLNSDYTVEMKTYFNKLESVSAVSTSTGYSHIHFDNGVIRFETRFSSDGLEIYDGTGWNEVGVNEVAESSWNTWKFVVTAGTATAAMVDVLKDGVFIGVGLDITSASASTNSNGEIQITATGSTGTGATFYLDYLYINNSSSKIEYWADGDFSEWTNKNTPTQLTDEFVPSAPAIHFMLNEDEAATVVRDFSASPTNASTTVNTSVLSSTGKVGNAFSFTSHNVRFAAGNISAITGTAIGSICMWINPDVIGTDDTLFGISDGNVDSQLSLLMSDTSTIRLLVNSAGTVNLDCETTLAVSSAIWTHIAVTQDGGTAGPVFYINGSVNTTVYTDSTNRGVWLNNSSFDNGRLGSKVNSSGTDVNFYDGRIDDFRVYTKAITIDEVKSIYAEGNGTEGVTATDLTVNGFIGRTGTKPALHYKLNDTAASSVVTDSGYLVVNGTASVNASVLTIATDSGILGTAFSFTSASSHNINMNGLATQIASDSIGTISFRIKPDINDGIYLFTISDNSTANFMNVFLNSTFVDYRLTVNNVPQWVLNGTTSVSTGSWHHICVVQDGKVPRIYLDGILERVNASVVTATSAWINSFSETADRGRLSCRNNSTDTNEFFYDGIMDDVRYYQYPLSESEIRAIYNEGVGTELPSPTMPGFRSKRSVVSNSIDMVHISETSSTVNFSSLEYLTTGHVNTSDTRILVKFNDISSIPSDATIKSASLYFFSSSQGTAVLNDRLLVHEVLQTWNVGSVTWDSRNGTDNWGTGGLGLDDVDASTSNPGASHTNIDSNGKIHLTADLNTAGIAAIQGWVDGGKTNNGFLLLTESTVSAHTLSIISPNHQNTFTTDEPFLPYIDISYTIPEQTTFVDAKIGDDTYRVENKGQYAVVSQTLAAGTALSGVASIYGAWIRANAGVIHKLRVSVNTTEFDSGDFTGDGAWQYRTLEFTPTSSLTTADTVKGQIIMTSEGIMNIDQASIQIKSSSVTDDKSDRIQHSAIGLYDDWDGVDSGNNDIVTDGDVGLTGSFIINDRLYVTKRLSIHRFTYTGSTPLIDIKQVRSAIGTKSPRSVQNIVLPGAGEIVIFLGSDRRLYQFDGFDSKPISGNIEINNGITSVYMNNINAQALDKVFAIAHDDKPWYEIFVPIGNSTIPDTSIIYDYEAKSFWVFTNRNFMSGDKADNGAGQRLVYVNGTTTGLSYLTRSGNSDDGSTINGNWVSGKVGDATILSKFDEINLLTESVNATPTLQWREEFVTSYVSQTLSSGTNKHNYNPRLTNNLIQFRINDDSVNETFKIWGLRVLNNAIAHAR